MEPDLDVAGSLGVVQPVPLGGVDARSFLHRVAWLASAGQFSCGVTALEGCVPATLAASDETAARLAEAQYAVGEAPVSRPSPTERLSTSATSNPTSDGCSTGRRPWVGECRAR